MSDTMQQKRGDAGGIIVALIPDLFFSVRVRNTIRQLGFEPRIVKAAEDLADIADDERPVLVIVDLDAIGADDDWSGVSDLAHTEVPVLVFGPHKNVEGLRRAKAAGVARVVSNSQFHREMPDLISRYIRGRGNHAAAEGDDMLANNVRHPHDTPGDCASHG